MTIYTAALTLILVMDPLGNIPVFLSVLKHVDRGRHRWIMLRESFIACVILIMFLFFGKYIMQDLHLTGPALDIAGGIILFLIAVRMIFPPPVEKRGYDIPEEEPFIVPLAVPMIAGPSAMAMVLLFSTQHPEQIWTWFSAVVLASVVFAVIIQCAHFLMHILGKRVLIAMERLMGMILTTLAVQMFLTGVGVYFHLS